MTEVLMARLDDVTGLVGTASNVGSAGVGVFKQKTAADLEFYKINSITTALVIALDGTNKIDLSIANAVAAGASGLMTGADKTKLDGIGAGANVTSVFGRTGVVVQVAGDYTATQVTNTPAGSIAAVNVQAALNELDTEKAAASHTHTLADITDEGALASLNTVGTAQIDNDAVTYAKIQNVTTDRLLGRDTAGSGDVEELTVGGGVEFTGSGIQRSALTGDVTASAGNNATTIANDAVTYAKMQNVSAADRLLGRGNGGGAGDVQEITLGTGLSLSGTTLNGPSAGGLTFISAQNPSGVAAVDFTGLSSTYEAYRVIGHFIPATDDVLLWLRLDANGGASFDAGASDYSYGHSGGAYGSTLTGEGGSNGDTKIVMTRDPGTGFAVGNGATEGVAFDFIITRHANSAVYTLVHGSVAVVSAAGVAGKSDFGGGRLAAQADNAFRLLFESGNIASGWVALYGLQKA